MRLHLEVTSKDRYYLGDAARYTFDARGGSIGRASTSTWTIEDTNSFMSSTHLQVSCHSGAFYITDVSTNGTFRDHVRLTKNSEDPIPLRQGEVLLLGDIKITVTSIENQNRDMTEVSMPPLIQAASRSTDPKPHYDALDELDVLAQQARLADVISQCYPEVDHGQLLKDTHDKQSVNMPDQSKKQQSEDEQSKDTHDMSAIIGVEVVDTLPGASVSQIDGTALLDSIIKALLVETQRHLAVDRIEKPSHYAAMSKDNVFRVAASLPEFYSLMKSPDAVRFDLQEVLRYLEQRDSTPL